MSEFIEQTVQQIERQLEAALQEKARLEKARSALASDGSDGVAGTLKLSARQAHALGLIDAKPGITASELSRALKSRSYGWTVVKRLNDVGEIEPCGSGWQIKT